jgi:hypothetical protein
MTSDSTTRWPLLQERAPFATASRRSPDRRSSRSLWALTGLAFVCGGLVSAAAFSIGWRHQAQRNTATESALAAATARTHRLAHSMGALHVSLVESHRAAAQAAASERSVVGAAARIAEEATASSNDAAPISSGAGSLTVAATRIASELKTLDTYLRTTPTSELDPGYLSSQIAYLDRRLTRLRGESADLGSSVASFEATVRTLRRDAAALKTR